MSEPRPLHEIMSDDWARALQPVESTIREMGEFLRAEHAAGHRTFPSGDNIFRAFREPMSRVKVLIVGQDPYPTPGHATGLAFSVRRDVRPLPRSLVNIYQELRSDLGIETPQHGDLTAWADQGVMLVATENSRSPEIVRELRGYPELEQLHSTTGTWDLVLQIRARNLAEFDLVLERVRAIPGVRTTQTNLLFSSLRTV